MTSPWHPQGLASLSLLAIQLEIDHETLVQSTERWTPCHRVIASEYAGESLFDRLVEGVPYGEQAARSDALREIADLTNPHILAELGERELVLPQDRVFGRGAGLIMAAFAFPRSPSRFSDGRFGIYYAARDRATAIDETRYHANVYLQGSAPFVMEKTVVEADLDGIFLDVRTPNPAPAAIYDPVDYTAGQALGGIVRQLQGFGILYDSVRQRSGQCVAVMRPSVLRRARAVQTLLYLWDGTTVSEVR